MLVAILRHSARVTLVWIVCPGPGVDVEGRLGNLASFENCSFVRNRAEEVGAAIGVSTLLYFRDLSNVTPFQITNWYKKSP